MPDDNPILRHWQIELKVFNKNLSILQQQLDTDAIHDLRVAIKKLRSYFKLYVTLFDKKDIGNHFSKTKELFSVLGKHRNIEMSRQLVLLSAEKNKQSLNSLLAYLEMLQNQTGKYCRQTIEHYEKTDLNDLTIRMRTDFKNYSIEETSDKLRGQIEISFERIKHDLKHFKEKSHVVRKELKDIFYRLKIFENDSPAITAQIEAIDKILNHLGDTQDNEVLATNLKNFRKTILPRENPEYDAIKKTETQAKNKKDTFLNKADKMTHRLLQGL